MDSSLQSQCDKLLAEGLSVSETRAALEAYERVIEVYDRLAPYTHWSPPPRPVYYSDRTSIPEDFHKTKLSEASNEQP